MGAMIIAEIGQAWVYGANWEVNVRNAWQAIVIAKQAGADAIKFQWTSDGAEMARRRHVSDLYAYWRLLYPYAVLEDFARRAGIVGLDFLCTAYVPSDIAMVNPLVKRFKVASLEARDRTLCKTILKHNKPVIVSTGCCDEDELTTLPWWDYPEARMLHCTASYPCPPEEANLQAIAGMDGLSDHTKDVDTGAIAIGYGPEIIEVHFRLDHTPKDNPDFPHSHPPARLQQYIAKVRKAELMKGTGYKRIMPSEQALMAHRVAA